MSGSAPPVPPGTGYVGPAWFYTGTGFNALSFLVDQIIDGKAFAALVLVKSVSGGGVGSPPVVSVQPLVSQIDGLGNLTPHGIIYNIPCFRLQGGAGAMILDPVVGDVGQAIICHRDTSTVKATGKVAGPGSFRKNDWADGCYFGGFLNATPTCYVHISPTAITMTEPGGAQIIMNSGTIATTGVLMNNGVAVGSTHEHGGVQTGGGNTGPPV